MLRWAEVKENATDWKPIEDGVIGIRCPICDGPEWMVVSERADGTAHFICQHGCSPVKIERSIGRLLRPASNGIHVGTNGTAPSIINARDLMAKEFAPMRWAVPNMIGEGLTILAGGTKAGKSYLSLAVAVAVASGGVAIGKLPVEKGRVLYLALEDSERRLQDRLDDILQGEEVPESLDLAIQWPQIGAGCEEQITEWLDAHDDARLIVVDVLQKIRPPRARSSEPYDDDYRVTGALQRSALPRRVSLLVLHHTRKMAAEDPFDLVSGSAGMTAAADGLMVLIRQRDQPDAVLHFIGRDVSAQAWSLTWDDATRVWSLNGDAEMHVLSSQRVAILKLCQEMDEDLGPKEIAEMLQMNYGAVRRLVAKMAQDGELVRTTRGKYHAPRRPLSDRSVMG